MEVEYRNAAACSAGIYRYNTATGRFFRLVLRIRLFDIGIVDANGDDHLDIYTSNHHFRQTLLIADGEGGYRDMVSEWGLDQSLEFPLAELSFTAPATDRPGLYIYWYGTRVVLQTHKTGETEDWQGSLQVHEPVEIIKNDGFTIQKEEKELTVTPRVKVSKTVLEFSSNRDGKLVLHPGGQGLPLNFQLSDGNPLTQVYVGLGKVSPTSTRFSLSMQDRHALAWADYNSDGLLDIFIPRGALGGALRAYPEEITSKVKDELLVSQADGTLVNIISQAGIEKNGCSGRHARWLDFNQDALLDLFINCYDRKNVSGDYPKQLYQQDLHGQFKDVAADARISISDQQIGSFTWIDVDDDGDVDLATFQDEGIYLYRNLDGYYSREPILQRSLYGADKIGHTKGNEWYFDGKLSVADYDLDGDLDIFSASKRGNILLSNQNGKYTPVEPSSVGLPPRSITANWVDYDNDGLPDLHTIPQGIYQQDAEHRFKSSGLLISPDDQYQAAISNWFDIDNDGRLDLILAVHENPDYRHWWEFSPKRRHRSTWQVKTYRNVGAAKHWLQIKLDGGKGNRQGIGARVIVTTPSGQQLQEVGSTDGAFFSQGHYRLYFGLGNHTKADSVSVRWSDGVEEEFRDISGDKLLIVDRNGTSSIN
jgi:hypothetical protein